MCVCVKDYVYVYDGIPLYPGFSSEGATLLATLCGSNIADVLTVTASSGVMTIFFEAIVNPSSMSHLVVMIVMMMMKAIFVMMRVWPVELMNVHSESTSVYC